jgi:hypothetical protein
MKQWSPSGKLIAAEELLIYAFVYYFKKSKMLMSGLSKNMKFEQDLEDNLKITHLFTEHVDI